MLMRKTGISQNLQGGKFKCRSMDAAGLQPVNGRGGAQEASLSLNEQAQSLSSYLLRQYACGQPNIQMAATSWAATDCTGKGPLTPCAFDHAKCRAACPSWSKSSTMTMAWWIRSIDRLYRCVRPGNCCSCTGDERRRAARGEFGCCRRGSLRVDMQIGAVPHRGSKAG